ncbi:MULTISPECIES: excinuclease ABC subunit C [Pseudomonas]|uniref:Excinuclease ABC subunit C n=1 Tax=Pseudomonas reactans TaxID=117680 RepID=A0A7Y8KHR8_9PSED|nr:excinuclease ABC subunit C [Pseudomonas reactans]NWE89154.1 excinuclease ABC subunit C [Pseudomonas reactans]
MPLHDLPHTFEELATTVLPKHMAKMREALANPWKMEEFSKKGIGVKTLLKKFERPHDFSGCYVMTEEDKPVYVGISRGVIARLRQHVYGTTHYDASLAFRIARQKHLLPTTLRMTRADTMKDPMFGTSFSEAKSYLSTLRVAAIPIQNPLELYVFEAYCALELDTGQWNTFATH